MAEWELVGDNQTPFYGVASKLPNGDDSMKMFLVRASGSDALLGTVSVNLEHKEATVRSRMDQVEKELKINIEDEGSYDTRLFPDLFLVGRKK
jgi:hypothetical protein